MRGLPAAIGVALVFGAAAAPALAQNAPPTIREVAAAPPQGVGK
jgi:hypothetical protein